MHRFVLFTALALVTLPPVQRQAEPEEHAVYRAVVSSLIDATTERLVLRDSTFALNTHQIAVLHREAPALSPELIGQFRALNAASVAIDPPTLSVPVERLTAAQMHTLAPAARLEQWWAAFYERFPNSPGFVRLSRVAFSGDGTTALVYMKQSYSRKLWMAS